jgi:hypothetical protein
MQVSAGRAFVKTEEAILRRYEEVKSTSSYSGGISLNANSMLKPLLLEVVFRYA